MCFVSSRGRRTRCSLVSGVQTGALPILMDLGDHRCLGYTLSHAGGPSSGSFGSNGDIKVPVSGPLRAGNGDALVAAAIAGMGIVYQPTFIVADAVADGRLEILELDHPPFDLGNIYAVYPPNEHLPAKVRVFIHFLIMRFAGTPPWQRRHDQTTDRN